MDELLVKYLLQEATPEEKKQVEKWLAESDANKKQLAQLEQLWMESRKIAAASETDEQEAWLRFKQRTNEPRKETPVVNFQRRIPYVRIAAILAMLITGGWLLKQYVFKDNPPAMAVVETQQMVKADTLADGSVVTLNKNSGISYSKTFTKNKTRSVELKGEAFFEVKPDKEKPFLVLANGVEIKVVGTSFNVKSMQGHTEVTVKTGIVEVSRNGKTIRLAAGEQTTIPSTDTVLTKTKVPDQLYDYYQSREFVCDNTPLWRLVEVLNDAYGSEIVIGRKEIRNLRLTTTFTNASLDSILAIVAETFQLQIQKKNNQIILQ